MLKDGHIHDMTRDNAGIFLLIQWQSFEFKLNFLGDFLKL